MSEQANFGNLIGLWASSMSGIQGRIIAACVLKGEIKVYLRSEKGSVFVFKLDDVSIPS